MLFWLNTAGNDVQHGTQDLFLQPHMYMAKNTGNHGLYVYNNNFRKAVSYYTSKSLIKSYWTNTNNLYIGR
ncbi:hypothetical protein EB001_19900 [bacterium]|nr:hypothetical protein [bacterium]